MKDQSKALHVVDEDEEQTQKDPPVFSMPVLFKIALWGVMAYSLIWLFVGTPSGAPTACVTAVLALVGLALLQKD